MHRMEGRARAAAVYPQQLCRAMCKATLEQARMDAGDMVCMMCTDDQVNEEVCGAEFEEPDWKPYWDDLTGRELRRDLVEAARAEELAVVKKMMVWRKVRREECLAATGKPPIKLRWVDINKGDELNPKYRSRIVAKEIRTDNRPELFAATPPLEFIKYLVSRCASRQRRARPSRLMIQDISKAYFFAPATRDIFIELPPEDSEPGMVGKLEKSL